MTFRPRRRAAGGQVRRESIMPGDRVDARPGPVGWIGDQSVRGDAEERYHRPGGPQAVWAVPCLREAKCRLTDPRALTQTDAGVAGATHVMLCNDVTCDGCAFACRLPSKHETSRRHRSVPTHVFLRFQRARVLQWTNDAQNARDSSSRQITDTTLEREETSTSAPGPSPPQEPPSLHKAPRSLPRPLSLPGPASAPRPGPRCRRAHAGTASPRALASPALPPLPPPPSAHCALCRHP